MKPKTFERFRKNEKTAAFYPQNKEKHLDDGPCGRVSPSRNIKQRVGEFEKRKPPRCYLCNSPNHLKYTCPKLEKNKTMETVNRIEGNGQDFLKPYMTNGMVNNQEIEILRDSGASIDLVSRQYINPSSFSGENVWVKQPLSSELFCLPLAVVEISGIFGSIKTKAAVCEKNVNQAMYLLGNRTAALIKEKTGFEFSPVESVNAVQTRAQAREISKRNEVKETEERAEESSIHSEPWEEILIPEVEADASELALLKVDREEFINKQRKSLDLKPLWDQTQDPQSNTGPKSFCLVNGLLVKNQEDKLGNIKKLLVVPEGLRNRIKMLCHEGTSAHLGSTKSKDKLNRYFYWPNCYREMDEFVRTCDVCQKAGRPNDKKKAPLKLVPVIREVFTKLNIDACGPLPVTDNGNRYIITAICMSSKYPEAIPVPDISSITVTDALLNIFSRMGFPRELQCDQGTSFTSALTTEFFERFGIQVRHSSVYHPQSNPIERFHRTLKRLIRALCLESGCEWDKHLPLILLALRTVTHESTGYTPSELVHGKNLRIPETLISEHWLEPNDEGKAVTMCSI